MKSRKDQRLSRYVRNMLSGKRPPIRTLKPWRGLGVTEIQTVFWSRTLSDAEMTALYNWGEGITYPFFEEVVNESQR